MESEIQNEPYYIARIMEISNNEETDGSEREVRVNWFQRSKDIPKNRKVKGLEQNTKIVLATMHWDWNPIGSIKGKCYIKHLQEV